MSFPAVPGYEITSLIGRGGMGRVYRARDTRVGRTVAVKVLIDSGDPELLARFESEARAIASLSHPNITQLYEFSRTPDGQPYCVMEYVAGGTLSDFVGGRPVAAKLAAELTKRLAIAVEAAHAEGILHRDLKPSNILIAGSTNFELGLHSQNRAETQASMDTQSGPLLTLGAAIADQSTTPRPLPSSTDPSHRTTITRGSLETLNPSSLRISDFGLARRISGDDRITRTGEIVGTPAYMAPEQASGMVTRPGPGVDVYSLGAILFELLTGRPPFLGADSVETIMLLLTEDPPSPKSLYPTVPSELSTICLKCLDKKPSRRYLSARELAEDLDRFLGGRPILAKPSTSAERLWKWTRRNPWKATAAGLFVSSGIASIIGVAALQAAYSESKQLNAQLSSANTELTRANADITESLDLANDSLNGVVIRLRDELYDVPRVSAVLTEISRETVDLQRRLYQKRPADEAMAQSYADALYEHSLVVWFDENAQERESTSKETLRAMDELTKRFSNNLRLQILRFKVLLDKDRYLQDSNPETRLAQLTTLEQGIESLLKQNPDVPEVLKLSTLMIRRRMDDAELAEDYETLAQLAQQRVDMSRRFMSSESDLDRKQIASLWLSQAQRELATALLSVNRGDDAQKELQDALQRLGSILPDSPSRAGRAEKGQLHFSAARVSEIGGNAEAAIQDYASALTYFLYLTQDDPSDVRNRTLLATALVRSSALNFSAARVEVAVEQLATAEKQTNEILRLAPDNSVALGLLAAIPNFRQQMEQALQNRQQTD
ncbi:MAG: protein kinase [Planctomyces sp.]|nr:protein kinase [Planctomyces sp.]